VALDFEEQKPAQEGAHHDEPGQQAEAREGEVEDDRLDDVSRHQDFEAEQQRAADARILAAVAEHEAKMMKV
jgi:hypothetical protein